MKASPPKGDDASRQIDAMVRNTAGWRGEMLSRVRSAVNGADPELVEEVKWKKPSNPAGVPVWSRDGIVCFGNVLKAAVRLTFPKGAQLEDPKKVFNTRLDSEKVRAVDYREGDRVDVGALRKIVHDAAALNAKP